MKFLSLRFIAPLTVLLFAVFSGYLVYRSAWFSIAKHFSLLAQSFLHHHLYLNPINLPAGDYADYKARQYLFFGPMPSVLLTPFVAIWGESFPQIDLSIASLVVVFSAIFLLARRFKFDTADSFWLANFFVFGTVLYLVGLVNTSAYLVQAVGTVFVVLAILEYFTKKRWFVMGILIGAATATRITLISAAFFFVLEIIRNRSSLNLRKAFVYFLVPVISSLILLGFYNYRRFGSVFDTGYTYNASALNKDYYNFKVGWFSPIHIPANLYVLLAMPPQPVKMGRVEFVLQFPYLKADKIGMAIWFTSPLFVFLFAARKKPYTFSALAAIFAALVPSLLYWGIGIVQYGYRYSLDFLPFLFLILLSAFREKLSGAAKLLIAGGIIFNCVYMASLWGDYPLFRMFDYLFH